MAIFNSYVKLPEGTQRVKSNVGFFLAHLPGPAGPASKAAAETAPGPEAARPRPAHEAAYEAQGCKLRLRRAWAETGFNGDILGCNGLSRDKMI